MRFVTEWLFETGFEKVVFDVLDGLYCHVHHIDCCSSEDNPGGGIRPRRAPPCWLLGWLLCQLFLDDGLHSDTYLV